MGLDRLGLWPLRVLWLLLPLVVGPGLTAAIDRADLVDGGPIGLEVMLWACWFAGLVAALVPNTISLTVVRVLAPAVLGVTVIALAKPGPATDRPLLLAVAFAALVTAVAFSPTVGDRMINGPAYGSERRMALRPPAVALLGPTQIIWLAMFAGLVAGPLLLANGKTILGAFVVVLGGAALALGGRILHQLARRWIVFVPAGFVIHDPTMLVDAVLLRRPSIANLGPAIDHDGHERTDLSAGALGLALEVETTDSLPITVRDRTEARNLKVTNMVFTPSLPGALLAEARIRGITIGEATGPGLSF